MEKVKNLAGDVTEVVTSGDLLHASRKAWGWMISVGIGLVVATTTWAVNLKGEVRKIPEIEYRLNRTDSLLLDHLKWAAGRSDHLQESIDAEHRLRCLEDWNKPAKRQLLQMAQINCEDLLGNKVPNR